MYVKGEGGEMGRSPCCSKVGLHKGSWSAEEDVLLTNYIQAKGEGHWRSLPQKAGLLRCGKSCRLRWMNYLRPGVKRGNFTADEEDLIIRLQSLLGNRWSLIAGRLPGRTDNEIKNHWNIHILKRLKKEGIEPKKSQQSLFKTRGKQSKNKNHGSITGSGNHPVPGNNPKDGEASPEKKVITMTKVYAPKPFRLRRTRFAESDCVVGSSAAGKSSPSCNQEEVDKEEARPEESAGIAWSSFEQLGEEWYEGVDGFISNEDQILIDGFDLSVHGEALVRDDLLEQVYAEYLSIFNLDPS